MEMAAEVNICSNIPDFAVICSFIEQFGELLNVSFPNLDELQQILEDTEAGKLKHPCSKLAFSHFTHSLSIYYALSPS